MNNTLNNGFKVLEYLAKSGRMCSVKELAEHFELPNSHVCRLLKTLQRTGYIQQNKSRKYQVNMNILCLAHACLANIELRNKAQSHLLRLHQKLNKNLYLVKNIDGRALIIDALDCSENNEFKIITIGLYNSPLYSATGKLCAAYASPEEQENIISQISWEKYAPRTAGNKEELQKSYALIVEKGYSETISEVSEDMYAVAAPIYNKKGNLTGALGSFCHISNTTSEQRQDILAQVMQTADLISLAMGWHK